MLISMSSQVSSNWSWFGLPSFQSIRSTKHDQVSSKCSWCSLPPAHRLLPLAYPVLLFLPLLFVFITSSSFSSPSPPALFLLFLFFLLPTLLLLGTTACTSALTYGMLSWSHGSGTRNNKPCFQLVNDHRWIHIRHISDILPILKMIKQLMIWIKVNWVSWYIFQKDEVSFIPVSIYCLVCIFSCYFYFKCISLL